MSKIFQCRSLASVFVSTAVLGVTGSYWLTNDRASQAEAAGNPFADLQQQIAQLQLHQENQDAVIEDLEVRVSLLEEFAFGDSNNGGGGGGGGGGELPGDQDADLDGFTPFQGDCDDDNDTIYPGAPEIPDDGIDNDCDGLVDLNDPDVAL